MAELATIARPYANAVFALAKRDSALNEWSQMLRVLAATTQHEKVRVLLESPELPATSKAFRLAEVCGGELDDRGKKFLQALADNDRLSLVGEIAEQYEILRAEAEKTLDVEVVAAFELTDAQGQQLKEALRAKFEKEISLESSVDSSLIGGAIIRAGDVVIDGSVRGRLKKLTERLVTI